MSKCCVLGDWGGQEPWGSLSRKSDVGVCVWRGRGRGESGVGVCGAMKSYVRVCRGGGDGGMYMLLQSSINLMVLNDNYHRNASHKSHGI